MAPPVRNAGAMIARPSPDAGTADRPDSAVERLLPSQWSELSQGESVWVHEDGWGFDAGRVDEVSRHQELIWIEFAGRGRRLLCGGDPVHIWTCG